MAKFNVFLAVLAVTLGVATAITDEEKNAVKENVLPILNKCREEFGITREATLAAKKDGKVDAIDSCFYACLFKKIGYMNEAGLLDADVLLETNKKYLKDEEDLKAIAAISKDCSSVNAVSVSDGAKGCERAKLMAVCLRKEKDLLLPFDD